MRWWENLEFIAPVVNLGPGAGSSALPLFWVAESPEVTRASSRAPLNRWWTSEVAELEDCGPELSKTAVVTAPFTADSETRAADISAPPPADSSCCLSGRRLPPFEAA
ncbi:hypothetical protein AOLI_G00216240 [Acnodon oligacanthus]